MGNGDPLPWLSRLSLGGGRAWSVGGVLPTVQPQCIEHPTDGFPEDNPQWQGGYLDLLTVACGSKPLAIVSPREAALKFKKVDGVSREDIQAALATSKLKAFSTVKLVPGKSVIACRKETRAAALLLRKLLVQTPDMVDHKVYHVVVGVLLGYRKEDIRAWHLSNLLSDLYGRSFLENRGAIMADPTAQAVRKRFSLTFERLWDLAQEQDTANLNLGLKV